MKRIAFLSLLIAFVFGLQAQEKEDFKITHGPYLCDMSDDGVTVIWTTNKPAMSWLEIAPNGTDNFYEKERERVYDSFAGRRKTTKTVHRVRLKNLEPGATYRYRILSHEVTSQNWVTFGKIKYTDVFSKKPFTFTTFNKTKSDASFIVLNDIHNRADFMKNLCKDVKFKNLDFVALNGDMVNWVHNPETLFSGFIDASVEMFASETPITFIRGNHETRGEATDDVYDYFPTRSGEYYYMYSVGKTCFLVLDGGEDKPDNDIEYCGTAEYDAYRTEQAKWLEKCVQSDEFKNAEARVVFLHVPPTGEDLWHGNIDLESKFLPILNKAKIDVMFCGHTHKYAYHKASSKVNFPVLVNGADTYAECNVDTSGKKIKINVVGLNAKTDNHSIEIPIK